MQENASHRVRAVENLDIQKQSERWIGNRTEWSVWSADCWQKLHVSSSTFLEHFHVPNQRGFLSLPLPINSSFSSVRLRSHPSAQGGSSICGLRSPPSHQAFCFKSVLSKHRHDGAWTLQDYRLPKGCWLHILLIIITRAKYTILTPAFKTWVFCLDKSYERQKIALQIAGKENVCLVAARPAMC